MNYFESREQAGQILAEKLLKYREYNTTVVSLSEGGVIIGAEIAKKLHATLFLLTTENITLPGEPEAVATLSSAGTYTQNKGFTVGQLEEFDDEYHQYIEQERLHAFHKLNRISSQGGSDIPKSLLKGHIVIIVSDGLKSGISLDVAGDFIKPIRTKRLIVATPIASVSAVDRMHLVADEICCLGVAQNFFSVDHYYKDNTIPDHKTVVDMMENIVLNW